jgi:hypothetical protein
MVHRRLAVAFAAIAFAAASTVAAQEPVTAVPLGDLLGVLRTVEVRVGDQDATMILDTGGGVTVITPNLAGRIGCTPWGPLSGFRLSGERLTMTRCDGVAVGVGETALGRQNLGVFDLASLLPPEAPPIDGILSLDALAATPFTLELGAGRMTLETPESLAARTAGAVELPIRFHRQAGGASLTVMVRVPTESGDLWMQLDAGSDAPLLIPPSSATALGLDPAVPSQTTTLTLTGVGGEGVSHPARARVRDMIIDGNIGIPVMKDWIMTFDLARGRLWVRPVRVASN